MSSEDRGLLRRAALRGSRGLGTRWENLLILEGLPCDIARVRDALANGERVIDFAALLAIPCDGSAAGASPKRLPAVSVQRARRWGEVSEGSVSYTFDTAGGPPVAVIDRLAAAEPGLAITLVHFRLCAASGWRRTWRGGRTARRDAAATPGDRRRTRRRDRPPLTATRGGPRALMPSPGASRPPRASGPGRSPPNRRRNQ
jgi:hypothetical protein